MIDREDFNEWVNRRRFGNKFRFRYSDHNSNKFDSNEFFTKFFFEEADDYSKSTNWVQTKPVEETERWKKIRQLLINSAEDVIMSKTKTWWQVYAYPQEPHPIYKDKNPICYGFSTVNGIVQDAPDWSWKGKTINEIRHNFKKSEFCQVYEIKEKDELYEFLP